MKPRTVDIPAERDRLETSLRHLSRDVCADWQTKSTTDQHIRLQNYRGDRKKIKARLRALRRLERDRAETDAKRKLIAQRAANA